MTLILQDPSLSRIKRTLTAIGSMLTAAKRLMLLIRQPEKFCLRSLNAVLLKPEE